MPNRYVIANWKMNLPPEGIGPYLRVLAGAGPGATIVVAPPYPYITEVAKTASRGVAVSAQNSADHEKGAYTGEISPRMVLECGARYVILGHSERRTIYGESDDLIARKLALALATPLTPVLCIGEDLGARDSGTAATVLSEQIRAAAHGLSGGGEVIVAYEPIWAIGTGRNASGDMVAETVEQIRDAVSRFWPDGYGVDTPILYGGSVTPENVADLMAHGRINGFLVGGASLDSRKFLAIQAATQLRP